MTKNRTDTMTVLGHLGELRKRIIISGGVFLIAVVFCFLKAGELRYLLVNLAGDISLVYFSPPEAFIANIRLAIISGLVLTLPVFIYEILAFLFPGLHRHEKKIMLGIAGGGVTLFFTGVIFAYFVVLQLVLHFFLNFETSELVPMFNITNYITFVITILFSFGLFFQLPLVLWVLGKMNLISTGVLKRNRKFALLIMLLAAAVITPPDIISQILLVIPLSILYELGIGAVLITERKRQKDLLIFENNFMEKDDNDD